MARQKNELLTVLKTSLGLVNLIVKEVLDIGGSEEDVRNILEDRNFRKKIRELLVEMVRPAFKVVVDYTKPLAAMIRDGGYDWVNKDVIEENFPIRESGQKEVEIVLFHFRRRISSKRVIAEMGKAGYRPATIAELLALGASQPELQKQFPIVALGSVWQHPFDRSYVPYLDSNKEDRDLGLLGFKYYRSEEYRFAAVRK